VKTGLGRGARENSASRSFSVFMYLIVFFLIRIAWGVVRNRTQVAAEKGEPRMITLDLRSERKIARKTLCTGCIYSHIVRGFEPQEEIIFCGFAFPQREILFPVRECTDFRAERVRTTEVTTLEI
jgi:hypothetical protein